MSADGKERTGYRIEYAIQRQLPGEDDFTEIGFGSTGAWDTLNACTHWLDSGVSNGEWETEPGQPDPDDGLLRDATWDEVAATEFPVQLAKHAERFPDTIRRKDAS